MSPAVAIHDAPQWRLRWLLALRALSLVVLGHAALATVVRVLATALRWSHLPGGWPLARLLVLNGSLLSVVGAALALRALPRLRRRWAELLLLTLAPLTVLTVAALGPRVLHLSGIPVREPATGAIGYVPGTCHIERRGSQPATRACVNALGHRGTRTGLEPREGERRILFVGDSFVYGTGVNDDETLPAQLERALADAHKPRPSTVINAGMPGLNQASALRMASLLVPRVHPDVLVIGYLSSNDAEPADNWTWLDFWSPHGLTLLGLLGVDHELFRAEQSMPSRLESMLQDKLPALLRLASQERTAVLLLSFTDDARPFVPYADAHFRIVQAADCGARHGEPMTIPGDGHPSAAGNTCHGKQLAQEILAL